MAVQQAVQRPKLRVGSLTEDYKREGELGGRVFAVLAAPAPRGLPSSPPPARPHYGSTYPTVEGGTRPAATYSSLRDASVPIAPVSKVALKDLVRHRQQAPRGSGGRRRFGDYPGYESSLVEIQGLQGLESRTEAELGG